jgi:coproporphyrinogen III oxidase-like Fe-S oxidoreductase
MDNRGHLAVRLEETTEWLQILQVEHRALQNSADLVKGHINVAATSGVHWGGVTPTFYKNKIFVHIGVHIKMHIKL